MKKKKRIHTKKGKNHAELNSKRITTTLNKPTKDETNSLQNNTFQIYNHKENTNLKEEKDKIKQWRKKLQARTNIYFRYYRNERLSELFTLEIQKDNPKVPRKFLSRRSNERVSEEEKLIKKQLTIEKVKTEIKLQHLRSARQFQKLKSIDEDMNIYIKQKFQNEMAQSLMNKWSTKCRADELKTKQKFDKKEKWFKTTWIESTENNLKLNSMNIKTSRTIKNSSNRTEKILSSKLHLNETNCMIKETKRPRTKQKDNKQIRSHNKSFCNAFEDHKCSTNKEMENETSTTTVLLKPPSDLRASKNTIDEYRFTETQTRSTKTNLNLNIVNLTLSESQFYIFLKQNNIFEICKDISSNQNENFKHFIAKTKHLFSLQKISTENLRTLNLTFNRGPSERKKLDVIIATADEKNLTSLKQSYDNVKKYKKDGNINNCSI